MTRPELKGDDTELQAAFDDSDWSLAIRLAEERFRSSKARYYEIVKICAKSQLDDPIAKFGALSAIWNYVDDDVLVDVEGINLLEWATQDLAEEADHAETLGTLRVRAVKATKDKAVAISCFDSCLLHWDFVSAQQIATILDRSFPEDRKFMFWAIVTTHLLAISSQTDKGKLYGTLAQRQIERAAQLSQDSKSTRTVQTEDEAILLCEIVGKHGSSTDFEKLLGTPVIQSYRGREEIFRRLAASYETNGDWKALFAYCKGCLTEDATCDWVVWQHFVQAAQHIPENVPLDNVVDLFPNEPLQDSNSTLAQNFQLAKVAATFSDKDSRTSSLMQYIKAQHHRLACFDDIKSFLDQLDPESLVKVAYELVPNLATELKSGKAELLALKLQYFTSSILSRTCIVCGNKQKRICTGCLEKVSQAALKLHSQAEDAEIRADTAVLVACCDIQLYDKSRKPTSLRHLLRALLILESQLTPNHKLMLSLLVQLHMLLGSGHRARKIWDLVGDVSLTPLLLDRLSTVAPAVIPDSADLIDGLTSHGASLRQQFVNALHAESYSLALKKHQCVEDSSKSAPVISLVEEARSHRLSGHSLDILQDPRYVSSDIDLAAINYGLPSWESSKGVRVHARLQIGPPPVNGRIHLSLLSEVFHNVLTSTSKEDPSADAFVLEKMSQICNSVHKFMPGTSCTPEEMSYFQTLGLLSGLIPLGASLVATAAHTSDFVALIGAAKIALNNMRIDSSGGDLAADITVLASLHSISMLRDAALASRLSARWLLALSEREQNRSGKVISPSAISELEGLQSAAETALKEGSNLLKLENLTKSDFEDKLKKWVFEEDCGIVINPAVSDLVASWRENIHSWHSTQ